MGVSFRIRSFKGVSREKKTRSLSQKKAFRNGRRLQKQGGEKSEDVIRLKHSKFFYYDGVRYDTLGEVKVAEKLKKLGIKFCHHGYTIAKGRKKTEPDFRLKTEVLVPCWLLNEILAFAQAKNSFMSSEDFLKVHFIEVKSRRTHFRRYKRIIQAAYEEGIAILLLDDAMIDEFCSNGWFPIFPVKQAGV
ncbi:hypothetical protein C4569_01495 [Candidatus Parcubacteria bacterium]|nr:MAG: hypothetical protein C4569_01495 [Candidatus Parcubacteria bacterium]